MGRKYHDEKVTVTSVTGEVTTVNRYLLTCRKCLKFSPDERGYRGRCKKHNKTIAATALSCPEAEYGDFELNEIWSQSAVKDGVMHKLVIDGVDYYVTKDEMNEIWAVLGLAIET